MVGRLYTWVFIIGLLLSYQTGPMIGSYGRGCLGAIILCLQVYCYLSVRHCRQIAEASENSDEVPSA